MDGPANPWQQCVMAEAKKGRGCFFYGCVTLIILAILAVAAIFFGIRFGLKYVRDNYTSSKPVAVAPTTLSAAEATRVTQRVDDFKKLLQSAAPPPPLELTGDELDYVLRNSPQNGLKDHVHLTITNDRIHAQLSLPLDMYGPTWFGRFFNGDADLAVGLRNNAVSFQLQHATVNGKPVPSQALAKMNQGMEWRPEPNDPNAAIVTNLDRIEVKDDKIVLYPKGK
jgi:hypothetical protein